jgi:hypothetical protein
MLRLTVSQYVLVSSSLWDLWPDIISCLKVAVSLWGVLSDERSGLSPVSHCQQCLVHCQKCNIIYILHVTRFMYMQYILGLCHHRLSAPCGGGLEYFHRSPCESQEATEREHSLRWDGKVWLLGVNNLTSEWLHCKLQTRFLVREDAFERRIK